MPGFFIVFEGPDGSGTTRHSEWLTERLRSEGKEVVLTSEPTHGTHGEKVRKAVRGEVEMEPGDIQKAFSDDRAEHVERLIQPALDEGKVVITDRYVPSTLVYGEAAGVSPVSLKRWNEGFPKPDITFILLPPFEVCLERLGKREENDEFEKEAFQRKVYEGYERYAAEHPEVKVIDTSGEKEIVKKEVFEAILHLISI